MNKIQDEENNGRDCTQSTEMNQMHCAIMDTVLAYAAITDQECRFPSTTNAFSRSPEIIGASPPQISEPSTSTTPSEPSEPSESVTGTLEEPSSSDHPSNKRALALHNQWEKRFQELVAYKKKHGNCLVPNRHGENRQLGAWVSTQRRNYKARTSSMTKVRIDKLESLGFLWSTRDNTSTSWAERYAELCEFYETYGHSVVPINYTENKPLSNWVSTQRQEYKCYIKNKPSRLTPDQIKLLNDKQFVWDALRHCKKPQGPEEDDAHFQNDSVTSRRMKRVKQPDIVPPKSMMISKSRFDRKRSLPSHADLKAGVDSSHHSAEDNQETKPTTGKRQQLRSSWTHSQIDSTPSPVTPAPTMPHHSLFQLLPPNNAIQTCPIQNEHPFITIHQPSLSVVDPHAPIHGPQGIPQTISFVTGPQHASIQNQHQSTTPVYATFMAGSQAFYVPIGPQGTYSMYPSVYFNPVTRNGDGLPPPL